MFGVGLHKPRAPSTAPAAPQTALTTPLCLAGHHDALSHPHPHFGSIYHVRGNGPTPGPTASRAMRGEEGAQS